MSKEIVAVVVPAFNEEKTIERTLQGIADQRHKPDATIVVDNGSTDATAEAVRSSFPDVTVVHEATKGTGVACNTGFTHAIVNDASVVMRTDADTVPRNNWVETTLNYFDEHPKKQIVGGTSMPLIDEHYRSADVVAIPTIQWLMRFGGSIAKRDKGLLRLVAGHNMAIRSEAFKAVGGFTDSAIDDTDEDYELLKRVRSAYGFEALAKNADMIVDTSMRRVRKLGYAGILSYYSKSGKGADKHRRRKMGGSIDVR